MKKYIYKQPFQTFVVGSLPRPRWVRDVVEDRKAGSIGEAEADRLFDDAIPSAVRMQERTGLDFVSDGEWRRESYVKVFADAVDGFENDLGGGGASQFSNLGYPAVVSKLSPRKPIAADEARFLRGCTRSGITVALPSPYTVARRMWSQKHSVAAYATREEFMDACVPIIGAELRALADGGVDAIQLDDPWLALLVDPDYRRREQIRDIDHDIALSVRSVNVVTRGLEGLFVSVHLCHAHFNRQHSTSGPCDLLMDALGEMNVDRFAMELATPDAGGLDSLRRFPTDKILGLGVIDHTNTTVETPEVVVERAERAMQYVPPDRLTLNPDCGFAPSSVNPMDLDEAYLKLSAMCRGAEILRERHP
jgi:5-methyltetrahydropteroyltriglutamate--homocysteine methyltransferase